MSVSVSKRDVFVKPQLAGISCRHKALIIHGNYITSSHFSVPKASGFRRLTCLFLPPPPPLLYGRKVLFTTFHFKTAVQRGFRFILKCFKCLITSLHILSLLVQSGGWLLKVHRLISLTRKCHCAIKTRHRVLLRLLSRAGEARFDVTRKNYMFNIPNGVREKLIFIHQSGCRNVWMLSSYFKKNKRYNFLILDITFYSLSFRDASSHIIN